VEAVSVRRCRVVVVFVIVVVVVAVVVDFIFVQEEHVVRRGVVWELVLMWVWVWVRVVARRTEDIFIVVTRHRLLRVMGCDVMSYCDVRNLAVTCMNTVGRITSCWRLRKISHNLMISI
jgi:hypothetical protein